MDIDKFVMLCRMVFDELFDDGYDPFLVILNSRTSSCTSGLCTLVFVIAMRMGLSY